VFSNLQKNLVNSVLAFSADDMYGSSDCRLR